MALKKGTFQDYEGNELLPRIKAAQVETGDGSNVEAKLSAACSIKIIEEFTIPKSGWTASDPENAEFPYMIEIDAQGVLESYDANVTIDLLSVPTAVVCGLCPTMQTMTGKLRFWSRQIPDTEVSAHITLFGEGGGGSGSSGYVLPVATADTLGGVKIGDNIDIDEEGRITPTGATLSEEQTATDSDIDAVVADVFGSAGE